MICESIRKQIDEWQPILERLPPAEVGKHICECQLCNQYYENYKLKAFLNDIGQIKVPDGLASRVISKALKHQQNNQQAKRKARYWLKYGVAAVFVIGLSSSFIIRQNSLISAPDSVDYAKVLSNIELQVGEVKNTQIQLRLQQAIDEAMMTVRMPPHIKLAGYEGVQQLNWQTNLKVGNNVMILPIQLLEPNDGKINIEVERQGIKKSFVITVKATAYKNTETNTI